MLLLFAVPTRFLTGLWTLLILALAGQLACADLTGPLNVGRSHHTATLLPSGKVLVVGGVTTPSAQMTSCELYDTVTGRWTATAPLLAGRSNHTAVLLRTGRVLVAGGMDASLNPLTSCEIYDPASGTWSATAGPLLTARRSHTATLLTSGKVLVAGGHSDSLAETFLGSSELFDPATANWSATGGAMAHPRVLHTATLLASGKVLVVGGRGNSVGSIDQCEFFNPATGAWSTAASLVPGRDSHSATLLRTGKVLVVGGAGSADATSRIFDPASGASGSWAAPVAMSASRQDHQATLLPSGKVVVCGGLSDGGINASGEVYDPASGTWLLIPNLLAGYHWNHTTTLLPSGLVLVAGSRLSGSETISELFDSSAPTMTVAAAMPAARSLYTSTLLPSGQVLITGGAAGSANLSTTARYTAAAGAGTWTASAGMTTTRCGHQAVLLANGKVLVAGGAIGGGMGINNSCALYSPSGAGSWAATGAMRNKRIYFTATLLPAGRVLVTGGQGNNFLKECEIYDAGTGTWSDAANMSAIRMNHTATLLPSGKVLVVGGKDDALKPQISCEIYDPASNTWTHTGSLAGWREGHTATLLPSGKVLVAGGYGHLPGFSDYYLNTAELYDPATGTWSAAASIGDYRTSHTATLLGDGKVLLAGGSGMYGSMRTCQLYDPLTNTSRSAPDLLAARFDHQATLLANGRVLISGGSIIQSGVGVVGLASCELYDPGLGFSTADRPTLTSVPASVPAGSPISLGGTLFNGHSEAGTGTTNSSPTNYPLVQIVSASNHQSVWLPTTSTSASTIVTSPLRGVPSGPAWIRVVTSGVPSAYAPTTIVAGTQVISGFSGASLGSHIYGDAPITITGVSGGISGQPVYFTSSNPSVATCSGAVVTIIGAGSTTITARQDASSDFFAATPVPVAFTVTPAALTVRALDRQKAVGDLIPVPVLSYVLDGLRGADTAAVLVGTPTLSTTATATSPVGIYPITVGLVGVSAANYVVGKSDATLTVIAKQVQVITFANPGDQSYGSVLTLGASASSGLSVTYQVTSGSASLAVDQLTITGGSGTITVEATQAGDATFAAAVPVQVTFAATPATLTVQADAQSMIVGASVPMLSWHLSGLKLSDTDSILSGTPALSTTATSSSSVGSYPITVALSGVSAANYSVIAGDSTMTVSAPGGSGTGGGGGSGGGGCGVGSVSAMLLAMLACLGFRRRSYCRQ